MTILEQHEWDSPVVKKLRIHLEERLQVLRAKNDASKSVEATEKLRGQIAECKRMLALDQPGPEIESDDVEY